MSWRPLTDAQRDLLQWVDNPANEDRWGFAVYIARRAGVAPRAVTPMLRALQRHGLVESMASGERVIWRRNAA